MATSYSKTGADALFVKTVNSVGPDAAGNVTVAGGGGSDPWTYLVATADASSGEAGAAVDIPGLSVSNLPNGLYEVRAVYVAQTGAGGTGIHPGFVTPAGCTATLFMVNTNGTPGSASAVITQSWSTVNGLGALGATAAPSTSPHITAIMSGTLRAASMSGTFKLTIKSEITGAGSAVIAKADSYLAYRRIAD